jgi:hypothetical protein
MLTWIDALAGEMALLSIVVTLPCGRDFSYIDLVCLVSIILGITLSLSS